MSSQASPNDAADIYVSYAAEDREVVGRLVRRLEESGFRVRWDQQLIPGVEWEAALKSALESAATFLLCIGPGGWSSTHQGQEYSLALAMNKKVMPVRLPGFSGFEALPETLQKILFLDYETEADDAFGRLVSALGGDPLGPAQGPASGPEFTVVFFYEDARSAKELTAALEAAGHTALGLEAGSEEFGRQQGRLGDSRTRLVLMLNPKSLDIPSAGALLDHDIHAVILMDPNPRPRNYPLLIGREIPQLIWYRHYPQGVAEILADSERLAVEGAPRCPYAGLEPHSSQDPLFFGREKEIEALRQRLSSSPRLLVLAGPAGCGKTSLVGAGLFTDYSGHVPLPSGSGRSTWTSFTITTDPLEELRQWKRQELEFDLTRYGEDGPGVVDQEALAEHQEELPLAAAIRRVYSDKLLFLTVDQFERAFDTDPASYPALIDELMDAVESEASGLHLLLIVRAEFLDQCRQNQRLGPRLDDALFMIDPMDREGLRTAIEGPAHEFALTLDSGLSERILEDVQSLDSPVAALSATMKALWEQRTGQQLTLAAYDTLGGARTIYQRMRTEIAHASVLLPGRIFAGYQADSIGTVDKLNIGPIVEAFSSVMLSKRVDPPLSIGLFGDWGSGKSFFMEEMWRQIEALAQQAQEQNSPYWHGHVAQIRFNAWHYSDANLWAAFVTHIFEELAKVINPGVGLQETRARLLADLDTSRTLRDEAQFELDAAVTGLNQAKKELTETRDVLEQRRFTLAGLRLRDIGALFTDPDLFPPEDRSRLQGEMVRLSDALGLDQSWHTLQELDAGVDQVQSMLGKLRALYVDFRRSHPSRRQLLTALFILLLPVLAGAGALLIGRFMESPFFKQSLVPLAAAVGQGLFLIGGGLRYLVPVQQKIKRLIQVRERLGQMAELREQLKLKPLEEEIERQQAQVAQAQEGVERAQELVAKAGQALLEVSSSRRFYKFIEERTSSEDYRHHLGLISMVRRDFEKLHELLVDCSTYLPDNADPDLPEGATDLLPAKRIERIILYIDDLDRCQPKLVVEVLQAVHLLLALPLFIVVVGVDSRWLLRALEVHYPEFLSVKRRRFLGPAEDGGVEDERATTPQNYLEKIFQIPFCLPDMGVGGFGDLIDFLANPTPAGPANGGEDETPRAAGALGDHNENSSGAPPKVDQPEEILRAQADGVPVDAPHNGGMTGADTPAPIHAAGGSAMEPATDGDPDKGRIPAEPIPLKREPPKEAAKKITLPSPRSIQISPEEVAFMQKFHPIIQTPRSAKRFVNVYRLMRAIAVGDQAVFLGLTGRPGRRPQPEYCVALSLLSLNIGDTYLSDHLFRELDRHPDTESWVTVLNRFLPEKGEVDWESTPCGKLTREEAGLWQKMIELLKTLALDYKMPTELRLYKKWAQNVSRFSFWPRDETSLPSVDG